MRVYACKCFQSEWTVCSPFLFIRTGEDDNLTREKLDVKTERRGYWDDLDAKDTVSEGFEVDARGKATREFLT